MMIYISNGHFDHINHHKGKRGVVENTQCHMLTHVNCALGEYIKTSCVHTKVHNCYF